MSFVFDGEKCLTMILLVQAEGIFRINPEACHEEHVREQLNKGIVPNDIDIHALAGLIKVSNHPLFFFWKDHSLLH